MMRRSRRRRKLRAETDFFHIIILFVFFLVHVFRQGGSLENPIWHRIGTLTDEQKKQIWDQLSDEEKEEVKKFLKE